jgi:sugar lactone lactonase YvrE
MPFSRLVSRTVASTPLAALIAALALAVPAVRVLAQTPFGGDDMGTIPSDAPNGPITRCDKGVAKATAKLAGGLAKCHIGRASGKYPDDSAEFGCEESPTAKFVNTEIAGCLSCTSLGAVLASVDGLMDGNNDKIYCTSGGTPFGGDDTGNIPPDAPSGPLTKCANRVAKSTANLVGRIVKCHSGRVSGKFPTDAAEDGCEQAAISKFTATNVTGCDPCVMLGTLASLVETAVDGWNGLVFCVPTTTTTTTTTTLPLLPCGPFGSSTCNGSCPADMDCVPVVDFDFGHTPDCYCATTPVCGGGSEGNCPAGSCGQLVETGYFCACSPTSQPCSDTSQCCPGLFCVGNVCTDTCAISAAPTCGGMCARGLVCGQVSGGNSCECVDADATCAISAAPACGGTCPSGGVCAQTLGGGSCECVCEQDSCPLVTKWGSPGSGDGQFGMPIDVAVDGSGNVYVADLRNDRIQKFTNTGTFLTRWGSAGTGEGQFIGPVGPGGVAVRGAGGIFVADTGNNRVQKFDSNGTFLLTFGWGVADGMAAFETCTSSCLAGIAGSGSGQFNTGPDGIAVDGNGNVFAADPSNQRIQKFTSTGTFLMTWGSQGSGNGQFQFPGGVAVDGSGNVFVADSGNARVQKFDNNGTFLATWGSLGSGDGQFNLPQRVAVDVSGNVFVTDTSSGGNDRIQEFTNTGTFIRTWGCPGSGDGSLDGPTGLTVDGSENVFVADTNNNRIQKFACP